MYTARDVWTEFIRRSRRADYATGGSTATGVDAGAFRIMNAAQAALDEMSHFQNGGPFVNAVTLPANEYFVHLPRAVNVREGRVDLLTDEGWSPLECREYDELIGMYPSDFSRDGDDGPYYWAIISNWAQLERRDFVEALRDLECLDTREWSYSGWTHSTSGNGTFSIAAPPGATKDLIQYINLTQFQRYVAASYRFVVSVNVTIVGGTLNVAMDDWIATLGCGGACTNKTFTLDSIWDPAYAGLDIEDTAVPFKITASAAFVGSVNSVSLKLYSHVLPADDDLPGAESARLSGERELTLLLAPTATSDKSLRIETDNYSGPLVNWTDTSFWTRGENFQTFIEACQYIDEGELKGEGVSNFHLSRILSRLNTLDSDEAEKEMRSIGW